MSKEFYYEGNENYCYDKDSNIAQNVDFPNYVNLPCVPSSEKEFCLMMKMYELGFKKGTSHGIFLKQKEIKKALGITS